MIKQLFTVFAIATTMTACAGSGSDNNTGIDSTAGDSTKTQKATKMKPTTDKYVEIKTDLGDITIKLYGDTPGHQANFLKLVGDKFYDGTLFHRVINEFMIQAGDPDSRTAKPGQMLGSGDPGYTLPAEIDYPHHFHKRGALAAARTGDEVNPERRSSGSQFYIVTGKKYTAAEVESMAKQADMGAMQAEFTRLAQQRMPQIQAMQQAGDQAGLQRLQDALIAQVEAKFANKEVTIDPEVLKAYTTVGGTPFLDNNYTVFGEVVKGMDVVDKIEKVETGAADRPVKDIHIISTRVVEM